MSELADVERTRRQHWAAPGSRHDRLIAWLRVLLPAVVGILLALLTFSPFANSSEASFVLDKNQVNLAKERMRISQATYRGEDGKGRPFSLHAGSAVQKSSAEPIIRMNDLSAQIMMEDGPASLIASRGSYNLDTETVRAPGLLSIKSGNGYAMDANDVFFALKTQTMRSKGTVAFKGDDGYALTANNVEVDIARRMMQSFGPVSGRMKLGPFSASSMNADLKNRNIVLSGNVRLLIQGNALK